jgi:hypothetical protein
MNPEPKIEVFIRRFGRPTLSCCLDVDDSASRCFGRLSTTRELHPGDAARAVEQQQDRTRLAKSLGRAIGGRLVAMLDADDTVNGYEPEPKDLTATLSMPTLEESLIDMIVNSSAIRTAIEHLPRGREIISLMNLLTNVPSRNSIEATDEAHRDVRELLQDMVEVRQIERFGPNSPIGPDSAPSGHFRRNQYRTHPKA